MGLFEKKKLSKCVFAALAVSALTLSSSATAEHYSGGWSGWSNGDNEKKIYIMHSGDLHGDTESHPNARGDATGKLEGGLARAATVIKRLKAKHAGKIIWGHTGDTIQGSAVATYTQAKLHFTDGLKTARGIDQTSRNTPSIIGSRYSSWFFHDGRAYSLWSQALGPLENVREHGSNRSYLAHLVFNDLELRSLYEKFLVLCQISQTNINSQQMLALLVIKKLQRTGLR